MESLAIIQSDVLVNNFWKLMDAFSKLDAMSSDGAIDGHHAVLPGLFDDVNFLDSLNLLYQSLITLLSKHCELFVTR